jgi:hypothetical protein
MLNHCYQHRLARAQIMSARKLDREAEVMLSQEFPVQGP